MHKPHHIHPLLWIMAACGLLSTLSAHYDYFNAYALLKPLTMVCAMVCVLWLARTCRYPVARGLLLMGLFLSMIGDICLLWDARFAMGLGAFLCAHIAYIFMLHRDTPQWLPSKPVALVCALAGLGLYAYLWTHGLPEGLRLPVLAYVCVITTMTAQAIGRAMYLHTPAAWYVAGGAISFMISDTLLALNKFVLHIPAPFLWILCTYYLAQWLIVFGMLPAIQGNSSKK